MQKVYFTIECKYMLYKLGMWGRGEEEEEEQEKGYHIRPVQVALVTILKPWSWASEWNSSYMSRTLIFCFLMLGIEPRALLVLNTYSTTPPASCQTNLILIIILLLYKTISKLEFSRGELFYLCLPGPFFWQFSYHVPRCPCDLSLPFIPWSLFHN